MKKLLSLLILSVSAAAAWYVLGQPEPEQEIHFVKVEKKKLARLLHERGLVTPQIGGEVISRGSGVIIGILPNFSKVKKGDLIAQLQTGEPEKLAELRKEVLVQERRKNRHARRINGQLESIRADIKLAQKKLEVSVLQQEYELQRPHAEDLQRLDIQRQQKQLQLDAAKEDLLYDQRMLDRNFLSQNSLDKSKREQKVLESDVLAIDLRIALEKKGITEDKRAELASNLQRSRHELKRKQEELLREQKESNAEDAENTHKIESMRRRINEMEKDMLQTKILADYDGLLSLRKRRDWENGGVMSFFAPGMSASKERIIADIITPGLHSVNLRVSEANIALIKIGQKVTLSIPALDNQKITARVARIAGIAQDRSFWVRSPQGNAHVYQYQVELELEEQHALLRPGMSCLAKIEVEAAREQLLIPVSALAWLDEKSYVFLKGRQRVEISGKLADANYFIVNKGLTEDQEIIDRPHDILDLLMQQDSSNEEAAK